ncbi:hypothetical protein LINPERHAP1_LOCUS5159 [Linum perenne]
MERLSWPKNLLSSLETTISFVCTKFWSNYDLIREVHTRNHDGWCHWNHSEIGLYRATSYYRKQK